MRNKICLFLAVMLFASLLFPSALAVSYPEKTRYALDSAGVLSESTIRDINTLNDRLDSAANANVYVVTRHFLGGEDVSEYANALFKAWGLGNSDTLLLMVIGEESYALSCGDKVRKAIQGETEAVLMGTYFRAPYQGRAYDGAVGALLPELAKKVATAKDETVSLSGLFGQTEQTQASSGGVFNWSNFITGGSVDWNDYSDADTVQTSTQSKTQKVEKETGFSIWKLILILAIFYFLFGRKGSKNKYNFRHPPKR